MIMRMQWCYMDWHNHRSITHACSLLSLSQFPLPTHQRLDTKSSSPSTPESWLSRPLGASIECISSPIITTIPFGRRRNEIAMSCCIICACCTVRVCHTIPLSVPLASIGWRSWSCVWSNRSIPLPTEGGRRISSVGLVRMWTWMSHPCLTAWVC